MGTHPIFESDFDCLTVRTLERCQYQGGNFGKKIWSCRPTADPTKKIQGSADRSPIRRRFFPIRRFCRSADFPQSADFADLSATPISEFIRNSPIFSFNRFSKK